MKNYFSIDIITVCLNDLLALKVTEKSIQCYGGKFQFCWIVVDGGSTDGSIDFVNSSNVMNKKMITGRDKGIYDAMNKGVAASTAEYFMFLNAGDVILSTLVELVDDKVNCYKSQWHDSLNHTVRRKTYFIPILGLMMNHQGMLFPARYRTFRYDDSLKISADLGVKLFAWVNQDIVMHDEILVSSLNSGVSQTNLNFKQYRARIVENYLAASRVAPIWRAALIAISTTVRLTRKLRLR